MELLNTAFCKYQGTGNDFILIDNRSLCWKPNRNQVARLCDRHFGIGADGLMLLSVVQGYDFGMTYFNSDGKESTLCGNGGRCMTAFAYSLGLVKDKAHFIAVDGDHDALILSHVENVTQVRLKMKDTMVNEVYPDGIFVDTGSPHFVMFVPGVKEMDVVNRGRVVRNEGRFEPDGTNVDFAEYAGDRLFVRTYERGVEDETLSCGTGVTAAALAREFTTRGSSTQTKISTRGGELTVHFNRHASSFKNIWLEGPATFVFSGSITLDASQCLQ